MASTKQRDFWYEEARAALRRRLYHYEGPRPHAKNVILLIGDGMGVATVTAARILRGQRLGGAGEDHQLAWDRFPALALARTYNADAQIGESSACATALLCGVKANFETVGLDARGRFENCFSSFTSRVSSLIDWAQQEDSNLSLPVLGSLAQHEISALANYATEAGKATGVVTTTRITHATPAALYAHSPSRYWEDDSKMPPQARKSCKDITRQLVEDDPGRNINTHHFKENSESTGGQTRYLWIYNQEL
uniref:alkaline phosphatase n=1 Tax=Timema bartmani TaxID=61472 RepID=A0A7R9HVT5_9NEOP|nr:unnamed protein product [Timema bartmani]